MRSGRHHANQSPDRSEFEGSSCFPVVSSWGAITDNEDMSEEGLDEDQQEQGGTQMNICWTAKDKVRVRIYRLIDNRLPSRIWQKWVVVGDIESIDQKTLLAEEPCTQTTIYGLENGTIPSPVVAFIHFGSLSPFILYQSGRNAIF